MSKPGIPMDEHDIEIVIDIAAEHSTDEDIDRAVKQYLRSDKRRYRREQDRQRRRPRLVWNRDEE